MKFLGGIFDPSSPDAQEIINLSYIVLGFTLIILLIITIVVFYIIIRFRRKPGDNSDPEPYFGSLTAEIVWTVLPVIIVGIIFFYTVRTMYAVHPPTGGEDPDIHIIGHQWWWELHYPKSGVLTANEVHIPVGKKMLVRLNSFDVIHSFWIPELAGKMDLIPAHTNHIWLEASKPGVYLGACAEFCGIQHGHMRLRVIAQTQEEFDKWQNEQLVIPKTPTTGPSGKGARLFKKEACMNCHAISGISGANVGPNLTHLNTRQTIGAGVLEYTPENLKNWLKNAQKYKPGSLMPNLKLNDSEAEELVAYLEGLK